MVSIKSRNSGAICSCDRYLVTSDGCIGLPALAIVERGITGASASIPSRNPAVTALSARREWMYLWQSLENYENIWGIVMDRGVLTLSALREHFQPKKTKKHACVGFRIRKIMMSLLTMIYPIFPLA